MPTYQADNGTLEQIAKQVIEKYHTPLRAAGVRIDFLKAFAKRDKNGDATGPALKVGGYQCAGCVKVLGLKDRAKGDGDAEIIVDGDRWDEWSPDEKTALIDHEVQHLDLVTDAKTGAVVRDDCDRPKLRLLRHDHQFGWFDAVARRHGRASFEVQQASAFLRDVERVQKYLPGFEVVEDGETTARSPKSEVQSQKSKEAAEPLSWREEVPGYLDEANDLGPKASAKSCRTKLARTRFAPAEFDGVVLCDNDGVHVEQWRGEKIPPTEWTITYDELATAIRRRHDERAAQVLGRIGRESGTKNERKLKVSIRGGAPVEMTQEGFKDEITKTFKSMGILARGGRGKRRAAASG